MWGEKEKRRDSLKVEATGLDDPLVVNLNREGEERLMGLSKFLSRATMLALRDFWEVVC